MGKREYGEDATAQDVVDALRFVRMGQKDMDEFVRLVDCFLDMAPETDSDRGVDLIMQLMSEASLKLSLVEDE